MNVLCVKLGTKYPSEMVNNLFMMCKKNITQPFEFFCYTDNPVDIIPEVNIIPYVDYGIDVIVYNKLYLFSEEFNKAIPEGTRVYFDLDLVITKNIDVIVNHNKNDLTLIEPTWRELRMEGPPYWYNYYNSSCMVWSSPNVKRLWEVFQQDPESHMSRYHRGMDTFLHYERKNANVVLNYFPKLLFYSHLWGAECYEYEKDGLYRESKWLHVTKNIPVMLFNGPTTYEMYKYYVEMYYS